MSRTYRRLRGDPTRGPQLRYNSHCGGFGCPICERNFAKELRVYHSDAGWSRSTPSWWIRDFMTVPQRQEVRRLIHKVFRVGTLEEAGELVFPLAKKPHDYYW